MHVINYSVLYIYSQADQVMVHADSNEFGFGAFLLKRK